MKTPNDSQFEKNLLAQIQAHQNRSEIVLEGRWACLTGASSGIGLATAIALASEKVNLILIARRGDRLQTIQKHLQATYGIEVQCAEMDVNHKEDFLKLNMLSTKKVSILVNNAGLALGLSPLESTPLDQLETTISTNYIAVARLTQTLLPILKSHPTAHIIHLGSIAGNAAYENGVGYCASKHALKAMHLALRQELCHTNVKSTILSPGMVETEFSVVRFFGDTERAKQVYTGLDPLTPSDVANGVIQALKTPSHVNWDEITLYPTAQANPFKVHRKS